MRTLSGLALALLLPLRALAASLVLPACTVPPVCPTFNVNNLTANGTITATTFVGNGAGITGVPGAGEANTFTSSKTFTSDVLSLASVTASGFFGNGAGLVGVTAATNANLTGPITSVGNATTIVGPVPNAAVDLSTVTTALGLKADLAGATFTGASGITNQAFTATGANGNIISGASVTASGFFGKGTGITDLAASAISGTTITFSADIAFLKPVVMSTPLAVASGGTGNSDYTLRTSTNVRSVNWNTRDLLGQLEIPMMNWGGTGVLISTNLTVNSPATFQSNSFSVGGSTIVTTGGRVGIGTTLPAAKLEIRQSGAFDTGPLGPGLTTYGLHLSPQDATLNNATGITFGVGDNPVEEAQAGIYVQYNSGSKMRFATSASYGDGATTRMTIDNSGNVGIRTLNPATRLHMSSGTFTIDGNIAKSITTTGTVGIKTSNPATDLDVNGISQFGSGAGKSTFTTTGALTMAPSTALTLSGSGGNIVSGASITASGFFGDGSGLSNVTAVDNTKVAKTGDTMTGTLVVTGASVTVSGAIAIGTGTVRSGHKLTVLNDGSTGEAMSRIGIISYGGAAGNNTNFPRLNGLYANGSPASPTVAVDGNVLVNLSGLGWNGVDFSTSNAQVRAVAAGTFTTGSTPGRLVFITVPTGTTVQTERMRITDGGNVGIGTTAPSVKLDVNGGIVSNSSGTFNSLFVGTFTVSGTAPPDDVALCLSGGRMGYCTTAPLPGCLCTVP